jgi:1-acyl-sn-glycerol-3-phosphate acyltransferase
MIEARHARWAEWIFRSYVLHLVRRHFRFVHLIGEVPKLPAGLPLLISPNHSTWWDGFLVYLLNRAVLHRRLYLMMLEEQLAKYRFFSRVGAFGIQPGLPRKLVAALAYSARVLADPANALCIFPQGLLRPWGVRPLRLQRGLERVLRMHGGQVALLPLGIRCELLADQRPEVFFLLDRCHLVSDESFAGVAWLEQEMEAQLDRLQQAILRGQPGRMLVQGRRQVSERWDILRRTLRRRH